MNLSKELGCMLYWGEGDKTLNHIVAVTNTNPKILIYFVNWLRTYFEINESKLRCRLYIWGDLDEGKAKEFWSKTLNIPLNQFTKSYISQSKPHVRKARHVNGVCRVCYCSTKIFRDIKENIELNFH